MIVLKEKLKEHDSVVPAEDKFFISGNCWKNVQKNIIHFVYIGDERELVA